MRHFPEPARLVVTIGGRPHKLRYLTRADVSALVVSIRELCDGEIPEDGREAMDALLAERRVLDPILMDAFPTADSIPAEDADVKSGLLAIVWEVNKVPDILEDLKTHGEDGADDSEGDPLAWPKFCLHMRRNFGIDEETMFHRWTYWQFVGFIEAAQEILDPDEERGKGKRRTIEDLVKDGVTGM